VRLPVEVVVEIAAVAPREAVRQGLAVGGESDDADHRLRREAHAVVHLDPAVLDPEHPRHRRLDVLDQLAETRDQARETELDRPHVEDLRDEGVPGLGSAHGHRTGRAVHALEVDLGDEVVLGRDLPREAVVRLEGDRLTGIDFEHGFEVRAEGPDDLVPPDAVADRGRHQARSGATVSSST
jgi:hypothetical protein